MKQILFLILIAYSFNIYGQIDRPLSYGFESQDLLKGDKYYDKKHYEKAYKWYKKSADKGEANGQHMLGILYQHGFGVSQNYLEAVKWFEKASDQGHVGALVDLGTLYYFGRDDMIHKDYDKAFSLFLKAADQDDGPGLCALGQCYEYGHGVKVNQEEAFRQYKRAAEQGNTKAMGHLGSCYRDGRGTPKNFAEAKKWYVKELENGFEYAKLALMSLDVLKPEVNWKENYDTTDEQYRKFEIFINSSTLIANERIILNGDTVHTNTRKEHWYGLVLEECTYTLKKYLNLAEGENTIIVEVENAAGWTKNERKIVYKPISNKFNWVAFNSTTNKKTYKLKVDVKLKGKLESSRISLNGLLVNENTRGIYVEKINEDIFTIEKTLTLAEGSNTIKLEVKDASGWASSEKVITYQPEKPQPVVQKEKRLALVIGNSDYHSNSFPKLENTLNDARVIHAKLKSLGFDMQPILLDANKNQLWDAITNFINKINNDSYDVAIVYYSGHGLSPDGGANYMIPIDANIKYLDEVKRDGINSQTDLIGEMERSHCKVKIVLMDCCNNCNVPERGTKSAVCQGGLSKMNPEGVYILHAAHPGRTAIDGIDSENSPFAQALLESIDNNPNTVWELLVKDVIESVDRKTQGRQIPYPEGIIKGEFYLNKQ